MPNDYNPPGLGKTLEDLIHKNSIPEESVYQWALRNANKTRALLSANKPAEEPKAPAPAQPCGKTAYEWAIANGKTCKEASKACGVTVASIQSYRLYYELPALKDGRFNGADYKRKRRRNHEVANLCRKAVAEIRRTKCSVTSICTKLSLDTKTVLNYIKTRNVKL